MPLFTNEPTSKKKAISPIKPTKRNMEKEDTEDIDELDASLYQKQLKRKKKDQFQDGELQDILFAINTTLSAYRTKKGENIADRTTRLQKIKEKIKRETQ